MKRKTIFFADRPDLGNIMQAAVGNSFDLKFCHSLKQAETSLESPGIAKSIDLIACGVHFDEGRMHDLLRFVRTNDKTQPIPFLCLKLRNGRLTPHMLEGIRTSSQMLGAQGFVHLPDIVSRHGENAAFGLFRNTLQALVERD